MGANLSKHIDEQLLSLKSGLNLIARADIETYLVAVVLVCNGAACW